MARRYMTTRKGNAFTVVQEDTATFADDAQLAGYLERQKRELEHLRAQKQRLSEMEEALVSHIAEMEGLLPKG